MSWQIVTCVVSGAKKLCLFGNPDGSWEVCPQFEEVPPVIPEPLRGINILRKNMDRKDWITKVSLYSDAWLISVTFYYTIWSLLDQDKRLLHSFNTHYWFPLFLIFICMKSSVLFCPVLVIYMLSIIQC